MKYEYEYRNFKYNKVGGIDAEINHPDYGWIPYTLEYDEEQEVRGSAAYSVAEADTRSAEDVMTDVDRYFESLLNDKAEELGYDNYLTCISWAGDEDPQFNAEGTALKNWRSAMYAKAKQMRETMTDAQISAYDLSKLAADTPAFVEPEF